MTDLNVRLAPNVAAFVDESIATGNFGTASDVISHALELMQAMEDDERAKIAVLRDAVLQGAREAERGEVSKRTVREIFRSEYKH